MDSDQDRRAHRTTPDRGLERLPVTTHADLADALRRMAQAADIPLDRFIEKALINVVNVVGIEHFDEHGRRIDPPGRGTGRALKAPALEKSERIGADPDTHGSSQIEPLPGTPGGEPLGSMKSFSKRWQMMGDRVSDPGDSQQVRFEKMSEFVLYGVGAPPAHLARKKEKEPQSNRIRKGARGRFTSRAVRTERFAISSLHSDTMKRLDVLGAIDGGTAHSLVERIMIRAVRAAGERIDWIGRQVAPEKPLTAEPYWLLDTGGRTSPYVTEDLYVSTDEEERLVMPIHADLKEAIARLAQKTGSNSSDLVRRLTCWTIRYDPRVADVDWKGRKVQTPGSQRLEGMDWMRDLSEPTSRLSIASIPGDALNSIFKPLVAEAMQDRWSRFAGIWREFVDEPRAEMSYR